MAESDPANVLEKYKEKAKFLERLKSLEVKNRSNLISSKDSLQLRDS